MILKDLTHIDVDVIYYALRSYAHDEQQKAETFQSASNVTGFTNERYVQSCMHHAQVAAQLADKMIDLMLEDIKELKYANEH